MDIQAAFKITAGVAGQAAVDGLNKSVGALQGGLEKLPGLTRGAALAFAGLGAGLSLAVFKTKFDDTVEGILKVKDAAEMTGSTVPKMSALGAAAKITGDSLDDISTAIVKMDKALAGSDDTAKGAARALQAIGLNVRDLRSMDPADAFTAVAQAMSHFEDSAGKTAIAMDIFGKSGAQMLPFLKNYAELGEQSAKLTQAQADAAEQYHMATLKLTAAKQELYKVISLQVLPVATDFVSALLDVTNGTNGVKQAAKDLAADGSMTSVFREAARAAAALMDIGADIIMLFKQIGDSAQVVWNDITIAAKATQAVSNPVAFFAGGGLEQFKKDLADRNAYVNEANERLAQRWNASKTPYTDALEARFAKRDAGGASAPEAPKGSLKGYTSRAPTDGGGNSADPYGTEMNSLGREAAKLQDQISQMKQFGQTLDESKAAQVRFDIEQGKFGQLSDVAKTKLLMQAEAVDALAQQLKESKVEAEVTKQTEAIRQQTAAMGMSSDAAAEAAFKQELLTKGIKEGTDAFNRLTEARRKAVQEQNDAKSDPMMGLRMGMNQLAEQTRNQAAQMKDWLVSSFDKAADALTTFLTTGKGNFREFAASILADLAKMMIKQQMFNALAAATGTGGGGASAGADSGGLASIGTSIASFFGFAAGGAFGAGTGSVVSTPTFFKFASGGAMRNGVMGEAGPEAIMPLKRGSDGKLGVSMSGVQGGGGDTYVSVTVQSDGGTQADSSDTKSKQLGLAISAAVQAELVKQKRPGGLLAAA